MSEVSPPMHRLRDVVVDGLIIGAVQAVVLVLILLAVTAALGNKQSIQVKYAQATACELAVPVTSHGRDPAQVAACFFAVGLPAPQFPTP